jgi:H-type small acid-soluble spore protein
MDMERALQILNSDQQYDVTYEGKSVWIDNLNPDESSALVHAIDTGDMMRVHVERLHEPSGLQ